MKTKKFLLVVILLVLFILSFGCSNPTEDPINSVQKSKIVWDTTIFHGDTTLNLIRYSNGSTFIETYVGRKFIGIEMY